MGERSSIFVRIRAKKRSSNKKYQIETFFGLYYQWCYGERMISRLRSAIDFVDKNISGYHGEYVVSNDQIELFKRYLAINFDMHDILVPTDLVQLLTSNVMLGEATENTDIFAQDENHGYIYIDISLDDPDKKFGENNAKIKYAFVDNEYKDKDGTVPHVRSVENFADHDMGNDKRKWYEPEPYWDNNGMTARKERFLKEIVPTCKQNMAKIDSSATLMTEEERHDFVKFGRSFTKKILSEALSEAEQKKQENTEKRKALIDALNKHYTEMRILINTTYPEQKARK